MQPSQIAGSPEEFWIEDRVPCLHWPGSTAPAKAAVICMSGGGGTKEDVAPWIVDRVTSAGVDLYSITMPFHGERGPEEGKAPERVSMADFLTLAEEAIEDLRVTTRFIREQGGIGPGKVGIRAISLSASCALAAIPAGVEIDACLSICGSGDHAATAVSYAQRAGLPPAEIDRELAENAERLLRIQPLGKSQSFAGCAVMMIHGTQDQLVPLEHHRALFDALAPFYIDRPQDCLFLLHAGKHGIRRPIEEIGWTWLLEQVTDAAHRRAPDSPR